MENTVGWPPPQLKLVRQEAINLDEHFVFGGHKMKHLFKNNLPKKFDSLIDNEKVFDALFQDQGARRAFESWNGTIFDNTSIKFHGECSLVIFESRPFCSAEDIIEDATFYQRYDTKSDTEKRKILIQEGEKDVANGKKPRYLPLSTMDTMSDTVFKKQNRRKSTDEENSDEENTDEEKIITHSYLWVLRERPDKEKMKKKQYKNAVKMFDALGNYIRRMLNYGISSGSRTVELVGKKSQGAIGFENDYSLIDHKMETNPKYILCSKYVSNECIDSYNKITNTLIFSEKLAAIFDFLNKATIEGFVLEDPLKGTKYKLRADTLIGKENLHDFANSIWRNKKMTVKEKFLSLKKRDYGYFYLFL